MGVALVHPSTERPLTFEAEPPADLAIALAAVGFVVPDEPLLS